MLFSDLNVFVHLYVYVPSTEPAKDIRGTVVTQMLN